MRNVELHAMMGKKPLHVSSEFLGEQLSAFSLKPDGMRRYSYKSLINPDLSHVSIENITIQVLVLSGCLRDE